MLKLKMFVSTVMALGIGGAALAACGSPPEVVAGAGSDTTFYIMNGSQNLQTPPPSPAAGVTDHYNASQTAVKTYEIPPVLTAPFPGPTYTVPHDSHCTSDTTYNASNPPPNGSSAGISALVNDTNGCIDFARSSRAAKTGDPASLSFWAFGLDALTWVKFPTNTHAPTNLTVTQLQKIYTCSPSTHAPLASNWKQVGGTDGPIKKFAPQTLSGSYSFFNSKILGGATVDQNCDAAHSSTFLEEHDARGISSADKSKAIYVFSVGQWRAQGSGKLVNLRNGSTLQSINGVAPTAANINTTPGRFFGTRYIYNVTKAGSPSETAALHFIGVTPSKVGYLCNGNQASTISGFGDVPLALGGTGAGLPNSHCRLNPTPL